jgi:hypothetical protein
MSDTPPPLRVGDRERRAVDEQLQAAVGDGVLTLSEDRMSGALSPGQQVQGYALMGKAVVDLRRDDLPRHVEVQVRSVMGEVEVMVPPGSVVHLSGFSVMGERTVAVGPGDGPDVHVDAVAVMGSVKVTVGDGTVVATGRRPGPVPSPRTSSVAVPHRGPAWRSGGHGHLSRVLGRAKGVAVPVALLGALVLAGPDNVSIFNSDVVRATDRTVQVSTLFGSTTVVVPDGSRVATRGFMVFGSTDCEDACSTGTGPVVEVRRFGGFGSVEIVTQSEFADEGDERDSEDDD